MNKDKSQARLVQLDGLRAIAVGCVLVTHFVPINHPIKKAFPWAEFGVQLFFVLSGYLITTILLQCRQSIEDGKNSVAWSLRQFYVRRALRIVPIYYFVLIILYIVNYGTFRQGTFWHFAYLSNVLFVVDHSGHGRIAHFWTLAIEEQFYLVWPLLVLLVTKNRLFWVILVMIMLGPISRLGLSLIFPSNHLARIWLPSTCLDTLGAGALLAFLRYYQFSYAKYRSGILFIGGFVLAFMLILFYLDKFPRGLDIVLLRSSMAIVFFWLVDSTINGFSGTIGLLLSSRPMVFVGQISYGIYIIHFFVPELMQWLLGIVQLPYPDNLFYEFILCSIASVVIASFTWRYIECPINDLKRFFPYRK